ncbi:MAG: hypothetical protein KAI26_04630 [Nanoarchaeota archaeon]|nr:hypothetical protein [Nanoarchaeota archaeon]
MFKISQNMVSIVGLIILISFLFRYYLSDMVGVMAIVAIAFIFFYFYSHLFESIARKDFSVFTKDVQTHAMLFLLLLLLIGSIMGKSRDPRNAFRIIAIFISLFLVVKAVLIEYYLQREVAAELETEKEMKEHLVSKLKRK